MALSIVEYMYPGRSVIACWLFFCLSLPFPVQALTSDVVFPANSAVGLKPPGEMIADQWVWLFPAGFRDSEADAWIGIAEKSVSEKNNRGLPDSKVGTPSATQKVEGPMQHLKLPGGIEAQLLVYTDTETGTAYRYWVMKALGSKLFATVIARAPTGSMKYTDAKMQAALQSLRFRWSNPMEKSMAQRRYVIGNRANFKVVKIWPPYDVVMTDPSSVGMDGSEMDDRVQPTVIINDCRGTLEGKEQRMPLAVKAIHSLEFKNISIITTDVEEDGDIVMTATGTDDASRDIMLRQIMHFGPHGHIWAICSFAPDRDVSARCDQVGQSIRFKSYKTVTHPKGAARVPPPMEQMACYLNPRRP